MLGMVAKNSEPSLSDEEFVRPGKPPVNLQGAAKQAIHIFQEPGSERFPGNSESLHGNRPGFRAARGRACVLHRVPERSDP